MTTLNLAPELNTSVNQFVKAGAHTQLVILNYLAQKIHRASNTATPSAFFSQRVHTVLKQLQQLPRGERYQALEDILQEVPTRLTEAYEELDTNMRMAFWYRLANSSQGEALLARTQLSAWNQEQHWLLSDLDARDSNELITFLRRAVENENAAAIA
ncbi:MAG: orange carotenoid protein N-terminal domain-containing protein [Cyanobacteria bacterium P01_C01_bin.70]